MTTEVVYFTCPYCNAVISDFVAVKKTKSCHNCGNLMQVGPVDDVSRTQHLLKLTGSL